MLLHFHCRFCVFYESHDYKGINVWKCVYLFKMYILLSLWCTCLLMFLSMSSFTFYQDSRKSSCCFSRTGDTNKILKYYKLIHTYSMHTGTHLYTYTGTHTGTHILKEIPGVCVRVCSQWWVLAWMITAEKRRGPLRLRPCRVGLCSYKTEWESGILTWVAHTYIIWWLRKSCIDCQNYG